MNMTRKFLTDVPLPLPPNYHTSSASVVTLTKLATLIRGATDLPEARRTTIANALDRVIALLPDAAAIPADAHAAVMAMGPLRPHRTGLTAKTLVNYKTLINAAVRWLHGDNGPSSRHPPPPGGEWWPLYQAMLATDLKLSLTARSYLSRLMRDCSARGLQPIDVSDDTIARHIEALEVYSPETDAWGTARMAVRGWNAALAAVPGWPATLLKLPSKKRHTSFPAAGALSAAFETQIAGYVAHMQGVAPEGSGAPSGQPFDLTTARSAARPAKPLKPSTIIVRCYCLRRAAGLLSAATKRPVNTITLPDLAEIDNVVKILNQYALEIQKTKSTGLTNLIDSLKSHARTYQKVGKSVLDDFALLRQLACPLKGGMTLKNMKRLTALQPRDVEALFRLPMELLSRVKARVAKGYQLSRSDVVNAQVAIAVAILLHVPLRGENLSSLALGRHIDLTKGEQVLLTVFAEEAKGNVRLDFPLPPDLVLLIRVLTDEIAPSCPIYTGSNFLFPTPSSGSKARGFLGRQVSMRIKKTLGLDINMHLFRHLAACLFLARNPGQFELVRILLGHADVKTTIDFYAAMANTAALAHVIGTVDAWKDKAGLNPVNMSLLRED